MYKHFFDKIALTYLITITIIFVMIILYASNATREKLITEKQDMLAAQASYISTAYILPYLEGDMSKSELQLIFDNLENSLNIHIWYSDSNGNLILLSHPENYTDLPNNLYDLDRSGTLTTTFSFTGTFYDMFSEQMLTYGTPVSEASLTNAGVITLHVPFRQITDIMQKMFLNFLVPVCCLIILSMLILLILARKILKPLNQLSYAAREYASGNFEVKTGITTKDEIGELANNLEYMASELNKLDDYRKSFIANISHDFRSPLTSIKGYIEAMLDGTIPKDNQEKYLNIVLSETQRLTKLTASMLELNKSDSYGLKLNFITFDILEVINATIDLFEGVCTKRYIVIRKNYQTENTIVRADKTRIQQVLYNLIDNAIKFSPHGATIIISVSSANEKVFVSVKDSGRGIEKSQQSKVWDRFYKADSSRGKDKQGSGLGLSIIREIIRAHDESITLTSTPGVGSEFTFSLKMVRNNQPYHS